jgi:HSP20 family molecular chaperone IbpA
MSENTAVAKQAESHAEAARNDAVLFPPVDVIEDPTGITLYADLPGVSKEQLHLQVEAGTLTIEGGLGLKLPEDMDVTHVEVSLPCFRRVFTLSKELDSEKVTAEFNQGVLKLRIPKAEHTQPRRIEIAVS